MKVGDKVRVRGGRKVCRVARFRDVSWGIVASRNCHWRWLNSFDHFDEEAEVKPNGDEYPLCKTCWPDGDGDAGA